MKYPSWLSSKNLIPSCAIFLIIALFYMICFHFSYNFFYQDDYHLLHFVTVFQENSITFSEKFHALFDLHNEHRIVFPRLFVLLDYYIQGQLDWRVLNAVAALYYLGIFSFFVIIIRKQNFNLWYCLPVALFIFQPASFENYYWTISILQQVGNVFWAMFLFYSIIYFSPNKFWISVIIGTVLTFTHGNGLFGLAIAALILLIQKRYLHLTLWIGFMILISTFYFWNYRTGQNSNPIGSLSNPTRLIACFGGFFGCFSRNFFKIDYGIKGAISVGLIQFSILVLFTFKGVIFHLKTKKIEFRAYFPQNESHFLLAVFAYFFITACLVALSRAWSSIEAGLQNRYLHNSVFIVVLLYVTILTKSPINVRKYLAVSFIILGMGFYTFSWYSNVSIITFQRKLQESDCSNYKRNGLTMVNDSSINQNIKRTLTKSFQDGVSVFPENMLDNEIQNLDKLPKLIYPKLAIEITKDSSFTQDIVRSSYRELYQFVNLNLPAESEHYLIFKSPKNTFVYPTHKRKNAKRNLLLTGNFYINGFYTTVLTDAMPQGEYQIGILQKNKLKTAYIPTQYKIHTH
jgi:hypothetical protein